MAGAQPIHVAAGVLWAADGRVLVQRRPRDREHGGLWEFPGGKLAAGETVAAALARELREELGIEAVAGAPRIVVPWSYAHRDVVLHVRDVLEWRGTPRGLEGQELAWLRPAEMAGRAWPEANGPIIRSLRLPARCLITPQGPDDPEAWLDAVTAAVAAGVEMVQLRRPDLAREQLIALGRALRQRCEGYRVAMLVNADAETARAAGADGVHWSARMLAKGPERPSWAMWVGASCHGERELEQAARCGADFALLSPIRWTPSHPRQRGMGWIRFTELAARAPLPVYALGGVGPGAIGMARACGGQGVAAIRGLLASSAEPAGA